MRWFHLTWLMVSFTWSAQSQSKELAGSIDRFVEPYVRSSNFAGTITLAKDGVIMYERSFGLANVEWNIHNDNATVYHLASASKPFTAVSILMLEEEGKLSTNDKLSRYFPGFRDGDKVTLYQLLTHTSGITNINDLPEYDRLSATHQILDSLVTQVSSRPLLFEPGSRFSYSNTNYNLLARIIEKVSGMAYGEFLQQRILLPLGMTQTAHHEWAQQIIPHLAEGYAPLGRHDIQRAPYLDWSVKTGNGSLYSTGRDLVRFEHALASNTLLGEASMKKMFTPSMDGVGCGWYIRENQGHERVYITGRSPGFTSYFARYPKDGLCIIVLSNLYVSSPTEIGLGVAAQYYGDPLPQRVLNDLPLQDSEAGYAGSYQFGPEFFRPNHIFEVTIRNGRLTCPFGELLHDHGDTFVLRNFWSVLTFDRDANGQITGIHFDQSVGMKMN